MLTEQPIPERSSFPDGSDKIIIVPNDWSNLTLQQRTILEYFDKKTKGQRNPKRADLKPDELKTYLPWVILYETVNDENHTLVDLRVRLMGTSAVAIYGERTGQKLITAEGSNSLKENLPESHRRMTDVLNHFKNSAAPIICSAKTINSNMPFRGFEYLLLPLFNDEDKVTNIFSVMELNRNKYV